MILARSAPPGPPDVPADSWDQLIPDLDASADTLAVLHASLATSTSHVYNSYTKRFGIFLAERAIDPLSVQTEHILDFLSRFCSPQFSFSYVNAMKSAVVMAVKARVPHFLLNESIMNRFLKGARRKCRPFSRKASTWDAAEMTAFIERSPVPTSIAACAAEAVMLLALAAAVRADDLWKMGLQVQFEGDDLFIPYLEDQKTADADGNRRPGITVAPLPLNDRLCPVQAVLRYIHISDFPERSDFLFVRSDNGKRITIKTLRSWLVSLLRAADISAPPGSTRAAAARAAWWKGKSFDYIARLTGWRRESTFQRHYRRSINRCGANLL